MRDVRGIRWALTCLTALISSTGFTQEVAEIPIVRAPVGTAALGGGVRVSTNPYFADVSDDDTDLDLVPLYLYRGKRLFARGTSGGVHLFQNDAFELNAIARYRFQGLDPNDTGAAALLEERDQTLDAGVEIGIRQRWGEVKLDWVTDTLNNHEGEEVRFSYRYRFNVGPWSFSPFISWVWQDEDLTNYYFGVTEEEASEEFPAYLPGESQWVSFGLNTVWQLTERTVFFGNVVFGGVESEVRDSPLVDEDGFASGFVGGSYSFGNVRKPDYIMEEDRFDEWSWRVNYGYQAEGNIVGEIDHGDFSSADKADTDIAGITLSKLLSDGKRVDFLGRFALFRHFESDEGNGEFSSYAAYISAMGTGYSPWSKEEIFRWSLGFGMSYAESVPIVEQRKQAAKDDNTAHFLNYLELTLDTPLRRLSKASWLQGCYAGLTVVHRSGIFGTSDFLGDVSGGSDWITAHLECKA